MSGTIIGEIRIAMIAPLNGTWVWLSPTAATVPRITASSVATGGDGEGVEQGLCQSGHW